MLAIIIIKAKQRMVIVERVDKMRKRNEKNDCL